MSCFHAEIIFPLKKIYRMKSKIEWFVIKQVRKKRKEKKMSQAELSFRLDVSSGFVGQVESKKCAAKYNLNHLNKLAEILSCSIREFFPDSFVK